jgi:regulator of sirC expression with transglutaminase-like and TPR domain
MESSVHSRLQRMLEDREENFDLAEAALLMAVDEYPGLDVAAYLARLDAFSDSVCHRVSAAASVQARLTALNEVLFTEERFTGNTDEYYDPRNSFLNEVLDRRLGIPITLSIVYLAVGRRAGLALDGISFPGHFLVKLPIDDGVIVLDPYSSGVSLSEDELIGLLQRVAGQVERTPMSLVQLLATAGKRDILARMLRNLKAIYVRQNDWPKALSAVQRIMLVSEAVEELRDRGLIYQRLECFRAAVNDYERYLTQLPSADDAQDIQDRVETLRPMIARLH